MSRVDALKWNLANDAVMQYSHVIVVVVLLWLRLVFATLLADVSTPFGISHVE